MATFDLRQIRESRVEGIRSISLVLVAILERGWSKPWRGNGLEQKLCFPR